MNEEENQSQLQKENEVKFLSHLLGNNADATPFYMDLFDENEESKDKTVKSKKSETPVKKTLIKKKSLSGAINEVNKKILLSYFLDKTKYFNKKCRNSRNL